MRHAIVIALLVLGVGINVIATLGIAVMRDVYDRIHYAAPAAYGTLLIAAAIVVQENFSLIGNKALATAAILLFFGPALMHVTGRSARVRQLGEWGIADDEEIEVESR